MTIIYLLIGVAIAGIGSVLLLMKNDTEQHLPDESAMPISTDAFKDTGLNLDDDVFDKSNSPAAPEPEAKPAKKKKRLFGKKKEKKDFGPIPDVPKEQLSGDSPKKEKSYRHYFKAWSNTLNKMSEMWSFGHVLNFCGKDGLGTIKSLTDEIVLQCVNRQDKNGTWIFEGDVVKIGGQLYYLKWFDDMCFGFADIRSDYVTTEYACYDIYEGFPLDEMVEIVDNIYVNEELRELIAP